MNKISAVVIVRNEENNIRQCLETIKWVDEIILMDQSSTDGTVMIAKEYTDKIFVTEHKNICNPDRSVGISKAANKWILLIEADERVPKELKEEMLSTVNSENPPDICFVPVKTFFLSVWIKTCGWYPAYIPRLFKKDTIQFQDNIHSNGIFISSKTFNLKNALMHYSYNSIDGWIDKFKRYTNQLAAEDFKKGKEINLKNTIIELLMRPTYFFINKYFLLKGYRDGMRGFFISLSSSLTIIFAYFKLWELYENEKNRN